MNISKYYLAIDIGASSGRHIIGWVENNRISIKEIYRFENKLIKRNGHLCWDLDHLFSEILSGLKECKKQNTVPSSIGIDTWGVDFVLLDKDSQILGDSVAYRDSRTNEKDKIVYSAISESDLYTRTGIQKQLFNSIYQLVSIKETSPEQLEKAEHFLMIPEYLNFRLTGVMKNEYTNATTSQLVNVKTQDWDYELMNKLGIPTRIFGELHMPMTEVGTLSEEIAQEVGFNSKVILPATHDTGSAVMAVPANNDDSIYLSSGTWSLMGIERKEANCSEECRLSNFTNEGGYSHRYRFLKNIMGMWMMQNLRREFGNKYTFEELYAMAENAKEFPSTINVNSHDFLAPDSMTQAIKNYCNTSGQKIPSTKGELLYCVYNSLAKSYAQTVREIEHLTAKNYKTIHVVGGGCQDRFLNGLIAKETGKKVFVGPIEATAIGNFMAQMIGDHTFKDLQEARQAVASSFDIHQI
ncbi:MAG: rhamnulokinase [Succinivibrio sp.]|nr:rhamnulokinase [Succinivibrio sp.]